MKRVVFGFVIAVLSPVAVLARTVSVSSSDMETGSVTLSLTGERTAAQALIATWAPYDIGNAVTNARDLAYVGTVTPSTTSLSYTIPADWRAKSGAVRFFLMSGTAPYEARYDSLSSAANGAWIDTGVVPTVDTDIRVKARHSQDWAPFGVSLYYFFFCNNPASGYCYAYFMGARSEFATYAFEDKPHLFHLNATGAYFDGTRKVAFDPVSFTNSTASTLTLFGRKDNGKATVGKRGNAGAIYFAEIREGGTLTHDYVPCSNSGVATLYDRVQGQFCTVTNGSLTPGTEVCVAPQDCGDVESVTEALYFAPALSVTSSDISTGSVTLTLGGDHDDGFLMAVADAEDKGSTWSAWGNSIFITKVGAGTNTLTAALPPAWWNAGFQVRFLWSSTADCPYDAEVEWIGTEGTAYARSGWIPCTHTELTVDSKTAKADVCSFGLTTHFYLFSNGNTTFYGFFGRSGSFADYKPASGFHTLTLGPSGAFVDGVRKATYAAEPTYAKMVYDTPIFFRQAYDNQKGLFKTGPGWMKSMQIREDGRLVRDFIPCVSNGVAMFYDRVLGGFYPSCVAEAFTAGEPVVPIHTDAEAVGWSPVLSLAASADTAVWDGGAGDTLFTSAANWEGDKVPNLVDGTTLLSFASAGTSAQMTAPCSARGLLFNAANDFTLTAANASATLTVGTGGITLEDVPEQTISGNWRMNTISAPVVLGSDQEWNLSANAKRRIQFAPESCLSGDAERVVTVKGRGTVGLVGTNTYAGSFDIQGGCWKIISKKQPFGSADGGGKVTFDQTAETIPQWNQFGASIDKPLTIIAAERDAGLFYTRDEGYGTSAFTAPVNITGGSLNWGVNGATVVAGGLSFTSNLRLYGVGDFVVTNQPVKSTAALEIHGTKRVFFNVAGNSIGTISYQYDANRGSELHCGADLAFHNWDTSLILTNQVTVDLHGHDQNFSNIRIRDPESRIRSDEPCVCFAYQPGWDETFLGPFEGLVSYEKSGPKTVTLGCTNTTAGVLGVRDGPLVIGAAGLWTGTNAWVGMTASTVAPSLQLTKDVCFADPKHTMLTLTRSKSRPDIADPKVIVDEGVVVRFHSLWIDGKRMAGGFWGSSESSAGNKDDVHFAGKGMIFIGGAPMVIIFR